MAGWMGGLLYSNSSLKSFRNKGSTEFITAYFHHRSAGEKFRKRREHCTPFYKKVNMYSIIINGILTGLILQLAIGPVFIFITNIVIQKSLYHGLFAVLAVTIVDYLYILLAIFGVGKLLENNRFKNIFGFFSSIILVIFGIITIIMSNNLPDSNMPLVTDAKSMIESFVSAFILTISSPLTILFWTGLFTAKSLELKLSRKQLYIFGISAGFSTIIFLSVSVIIVSRIKNIIPIPIINYMNIMVGIVLLFYGTWRMLDISRTARGKK